MKPCTSGKKHKWVFVRNVTNTRTTITASHSWSVSSLRGLYRCTVCDLKKHDTPRHGGGDLRTAQEAQA